MNSFDSKPTNLPGWNGISGPPVISTATTPANWIIKQQLQKISQKERLLWIQCFSLCTIDHLVEISVGEDRKLYTDRFDQPQSDIKSSISSMI